jgi:hypothetical protein
VATLATSAIAGKRRTLCRFAVGLLLLLLLISACARMGAQDSARAQCERVASRFGEESTVSGAFETDVGALRSIQPLEAEPELFPEAADGQSAVLCYLDGPIGKGPPLGPNGEVRDPYDRSLVGIVGDTDQLIRSGYQASLPISPP